MEISEECVGPYIICPWCGHLDRDSWEFNNGKEGGVDVECGSCDKPIRVNRVVTVSYRVSKIHE